MMNKLIREHYGSEDIQRLNMFTDVNKWKSEVTFIDLENQFYKKLFSSRLIEKTDINLQDLYYLQQELESLDLKNQAYLEKLMAFILELDGFSECDDLQCETFYLNELQKFKIEIENYFFENRNLKTLIYSYINNGLKKLL
ncbi:MAG: hypothetical protein ABJ092_14115 [Gillisia sp.]